MKFVGISLYQDQSELKQDQKLNQAKPILFLGAPTVLGGFWSCVENPAKINLKRFFKENVT